MENPPAGEKEQMEMEAGEEGRCELKVISQKNQTTKKPLRRSPTGANQQQINRETGQTEKTVHSEDVDTAERTARSSSKSNEILET